MQGTFFIVPSINVKSVFFIRAVKTLATQAIIEGQNGVIFKNASLHLKIANRNIF